MKTTQLHAREILESLGNPTVEGDVVLEGGAAARVAVPWGASTGEREALELRDANKNRYGGKGVRMNQIGTVTETLDAAVHVASQAGSATIASHRFGETEDSTIADLAVGTAAGQIKTGSASRSDRVCECNRPPRIEEELGKTAVFAGRSAIRHFASR